MRVGVTSSGTVAVRTSILSSLGAVARPFALDSEPNQAGRGGLRRDGVDAADTLATASLDLPSVPLLHSLPPPLDDEESWFID